MSAQLVVLLEVGQQAWPRWMIVHRGTRRYWSNGSWKKRRRNGDLWSNRAEAEQALHVARSGSEA